MDEDPPALCTASLPSCKNYSDDADSPTENMTSKMESSVANNGMLSSETLSTISNNEDKTKKLSILQSSSVLVNYISIGYILLPGGFALGGVFWTSILLAFVSLQSYISGVFVLEACARAEASENVQILTSASRHGQRGLPRSYSVEVQDRKFELSELSRFFLGRHWSNFFTLTTCCDLYGLTWTLAAVFGQAMTDGLPISGSGVKEDKAFGDYEVYIVIFAAIVVPLSCLRIGEQIWFQIGFLSLRLLMVCLMIATTVVGYISPFTQFGTQIGARGDIPLFNFQNTIKAATICVFSTAYQFAVPNLTHETENKKAMVPVIKCGVSFVYMSNLVLSLAVSIFFGPATTAASNLNWTNYHGGTWDGEGEVAENRAVWASLISQYIVLFAAIDGLAIYPLCCISLGEILMGAIFEKHAHQVETHDWKVRTAFRLCACLPQAIGAIFVNDLGSIATYASIFTLLSYTVCPCLLNIYSQQRLNKENESGGHQRSQTIYHSRIISRSATSWVLIATSIALIVGVIVESIIF